MALLGKQGLRDVAYQNLAKARYAFEQLKQIPGVRAPFSAPIFNELFCKPKSRRKSATAVLERGVIAGLPIKKWYPDLENTSLWCVTETKTKATSCSWQTFREVL